ncbi:MAG: helix-turn-helix domain-containing protein [Candidatus Neomarinimicrobiota bacterium]
MDHSKLDLLSIEEAAKQYPVSTSKLYKLVRLKKIRHRKCGRLVFFDRCDIETLFVLVNPIVDGVPITREQEMVSSQVERILAG